MTVVFCKALADKKTVLSLWKSRKLAGLWFNWAALQLLDNPVIVHLAEDTYAVLKSWADPELFGFEGTTPIYYTSQGLEQFWPQPLAIKETAAVSGGDVSRVGAQRHWAHQVFDQNVMF